MGLYLRLLPALALVLLPACGLAGMVDSQSKFDTPPGESMAPSEQALAHQVHALVNAERAARDLPPLIWDDQAADVGYDHCVDMHVRGFYAHTNPDGLRACDRMRAAGVPMDMCGGENLARLHDSPARVVGAWMASPEHRDAILAPTFTHVGAAVHTGSGGPWWALEFFHRVE